MKYSRRLTILIAASFTLSGYLLLYRDSLHSFTSQYYVYLQLRLNRMFFHEAIGFINISMDHSSVIENIRKNLVAPSPKNLLSISDGGKKGHYSQFGESVYLESLFNETNNGFFVECGAYDGEFASNSLFFEIRKNWTGLLVEMDSKTYAKLLTKRRNAFSIRACLSPVPYPKHMKYREWGLVGALNDYQPKEHLAGASQMFPSGFVQSNVTCYPLYSILLAINQTRIDLFSLDVEGPEIEILKTIPFEKVFIDVIIVEYKVWNAKTVSDLKLAKIRQFFSVLPYQEVGTVGGIDIVFRRKK